MLQYLLTMLQAREDEGQGLVEYALIIALVSVVCATALIALQGQIDGVFGAIGAAFGV